MKKNNIILGCIFSIALLGVQSFAFADFREHYELAQEYFHKSQYSSSIDEFKKALRINYLDNSARIGIVNAYLARGTYYANNGNLSKGADDFRSALFYIKYYPLKDVPTNTYATESSANNSLKYCLDKIGFDYSAESRYNKADMLRTEGLFPAAVYELEQIRNNPKYQKEATAQIADMIKLLGNNERAADYYKDALRLDPHNGPLLLRYARLLDKLGRQDEAVVQYNQALAESDNDKEILYALERIYAKKLEASPRDAELNANIGAIKQKQKDYVNALAYYKRAEEYSNASTDINSKINTRLNIGTLFQAQNNYAKALEVYKSILVEYPDNLNANLYTAQCYELSGENSKALTYYQKALALDPTNSQIRKDIVTLKRNSMSPDELLAYVENNSQVDKSMVNIMYDYAMDYHKKNDVDTAIKFYRGVLKVEKNNPEVYTNIALCFIEKQDYDSAKEILLNAKQRFPNNKIINDTLSDLDSAIVSETNADAYEAFNNKDYGKALEYYKRALSMNPNSVETLYSIAALYYNQQNWNEAKNYLNRALAINSNHKEAQNLMREVKKVTSQVQLQKGADLFNRGYVDEALTSFKQAITDDDTNANAYYYRGLAYDAKKNYQEAINDYQKALQNDKNLHLVNYLLAVDYDNLGRHLDAKNYFKLFVESYNLKDQYFEYAQTRLKQLENVK